MRGAQNEVADALSRIEINSIQFPDGVDYDEMAAAQEREGLANHGHDSSVILFPLPKSNRSILCVQTEGVARPLVPASFRRKVFDLLHGLSHPGIRGTIKLFAKRFSWKGLQKDVRDWVRSCLRCQRSKVHRHTKSPVGTIDAPDARFDHVHVDLVGPLSISRGCRYLVTCVDHFTRWCEAVPLPDISADSVVLAFLQHWVARFGSPRIITTDRGAQFESVLFNRLCNFLGCERHRTTAYHPAANGMVERLHRQLKASLMSSDHAGNWVDNLPLVLLGIRSTLKPDIGSCSAELVYGATLRLPGELLVTTQPAIGDIDDILHRIRQFARVLKPRPSRLPSRPTHVDAELQTCTHVFLRCDRVRRSLQPPYDGPFPVISRTHKTFRICVNGRETNVSIDRLKPGFVEQPSLSLPTTLSTDQLGSSAASALSAPSTSTSDPLSAHPTDIPRQKCLTSPSSRKTRSGRQVHFPDRFGS